MTKEKIYWGGSGIQKELFDWVRNNLENGKILIEVGAGKVSTREFSKYYNVISIEHNKNFCNIYDNKYIYAPLKNNWYDISCIEKELPKKHDLILIDGPDGSEVRLGFEKNIHLFDNTSIMVFHDTWRKPEREMAKRLSKRFNKSIEYFDIDKTDSFIIVR